MSGLKKIFNGETEAGRANVAKATYAAIALGYLFYRVTRKPKPPKQEPVVMVPPPKYEEDESFIEVPPSRPEEDCIVEEAPAPKSAPKYKPPPPPLGPPPPKQPLKPAEPPTSKSTERGKDSTEVNEKCATYIPQFDSPDEAHPSKSSRKSNVAYEKPRDTPEPPSYACL